MKKTSTGMTAAVALGLTLGSVGAGAMKPAWAKDSKGVEKCAGVVKKGKNDCGTKKHGCGGMAKADNMADEWVYMPSGLCDKVGGTVLQAKAKPKAKMKMKK